MVQLEDLGGKFSGEVKECREQLNRSLKQLQICREKMSECREEHTKSRIQLQQCQEKLTECQQNLIRCRDKLKDSCSQITNCIKGLKQISENLSKQIQELTIAAGGIIGAGAGAGAAFVIGAVTGPVGALIAAGIGGSLGIFGGDTVARKRENELEEKRKKLCEYECELYDCGERCKEILRKSEEELKELQRIVDGLEEPVWKV